MFNIEKERELIEKSWHLASKDRDVSEFHADELLELINECEATLNEIDGHFSVSSTSSEFKERKEFVQKIKVEIKKIQIRNQDRVNKIFEQVYVNKNTDDYKDVWKTETKTLFSVFASKKLEKEVKNLEKTFEEKIENSRRELTNELDNQRSEMNLRLEDMKLNLHNMRRISDFESGRYFKCFGLEFEVQISEITFDSVLSGGAAFRVNYQVKGLSSRNVFFKLYTKKGEERWIDKKFFDYDFFRFIIDTILKMENRKDTLFENESWDQKNEVEQKNKHFINSIIELSEEYDYYSSQNYFAPNSLFVTNAVTKCIPDFYSKDKKMPRV